jgi:hypothetical protein
MESESIDRRELIRGAMRLARQAQIAEDIDTIGDEDFRDVTITAAASMAMSLAAIADMMDEDRRPKAMIQPTAERVSSRGRQPTDSARDGGD